MNTAKYAIRLEQHDNGTINLSEIYRVRDTRTSKRTEYRTYVETIEVFDTKAEAQNAYAQINDIA